MKAYEAYRESGVEWVGRVPTHWRVFSLKYLVSMQSGDAITSEQIEEVGEFPVFGGNGLRGYTGTHTHQGDFVLIGRQGALCGNINYARGQFWASEHAVVVSPKFPCAIIWLGELLRCMNLGQYSVSAAQPGLSVEALGNLRIPVPPPEEQSAIAAFLDQETGKIDALVAEQERLIALLKEKRQAVISQAVTKGLNPNAPMKDSGIEWLGQVPAHWEVAPIKRFLTSCNSRRIPLSGEERSARSGPYPYYGASGIVDHIDDFLFSEDLILVSEDGANLLSRSSPIAFVATGKYWVNNHAHILRAPDSNLLFWSQRIEAINITPFVTGSAQPKFTAEALAATILSVPPTEAERAIIQRYIEIEARQFDTLITEATQAITLLRERRAALISAAVTGKIDVRSLAPTKQEAA